MDDNIPVVLSAREYREKMEGLLSAEQDKVKRLREYVSHTNRCSAPSTLYMDGTMGKCTCGLDELLKETE